MFWTNALYSDFFKSIGKPMEFAKKTALPSGEFIYYIEEGLAALTMLMPNGDEKVYMYFKPGNLVGFARFSIPTEHFAESYIPINLNYVVAKTSLSVFAINNEDFYAAIEQDPKLHKDLSMAMTQNLSNVLEHSYWLASADASTRLCLMLINFMEETGQQLTIPRCLTYMEMANFLSIHTVTVAKIVKSLVAEAILGRQGQQLIVTDPERLRKVAHKDISLRY